MPKLSPMYEEKLKRAIRDAYAIDPLITRASLMENLEKRFDHSFDHNYIRKLADKVTKQARLEADHMKVEDRLTKLRETYRVGRERLMQVLFWTPESASMRGIKPPLPMDIIEAAKALVVLDIAVLNAELANGLYRKPIEEIAKQLHYEPLPGPVRAEIVSAWRRFNMLPAHVVEEVVGPSSDAKTS